MTADPHSTRLLSVRAQLGHLNADELEAIEYLVLKLLDGKAKHGPLVIDEDGRDFMAELVQEYADGAFYAAFSVIRKRRAA
jgi:hypothetical protein